jgi:DNA-binding HxlR family transcriptional regulator
MRRSERRREPCSMARTISVVGDRQSLMILRDYFLRIRRFEDFERSLGISRHLLPDRLRKLVKAGVPWKAACSERPKRYEYRLTEKDVDLYPIMMSIVHWGDTPMAGTKGRPLLREHIACRHTFDPVMACSHCEEEITARAVRLRPGPAREKLPI